MRTLWCSRLAPRILKLNKLTEKERKKERKKGHLKNIDLRLYANFKCDYYGADWQIGTEELKIK